MWPDNKASTLAGISLRAASARVLLSPTVKPNTETPVAQIGRWNATQTGPVGANRAMS